MSHPTDRRPRGDAVQAVPGPRRVAGELAAFNELFGGLLEWLPRLHDRERGGFYYALSSTDAPGFEADIESTCAALRIMDHYELLDALPTATRAGLVAFLRTRQDAETGFFLDRHNEMRAVERMRGRALQLATSALERLGAEPPHPLPGAGPGGRELWEHLGSVRAFERWLDRRPWDDSWLAQDNIQAQAALIGLLPKDRQEALVDTALRYVRARQESATGLAGGGSPYVRVSGAFKLALFCRAFGRPVPGAERIRESTLRCVREEECADACWLRNPIELVEVLEPQLGAMSRRDADELVRVSTANAARFARADGGFSRHVDASPEAPNEVRLGLGRVEGDLNASVQLAVIVRPALHRLAGVAPPALPGREGWAGRFAAADGGR